MAKIKTDGSSAVDEVGAIPAEELHDPIEEAQDEQTDIVVTAAAVAVVGVGVAVFEAALLPGVVLGVAAMLVPRVLPNIGAAVTPLVRSTVRGAYKFGQKTKEMVAEAHEHVNDIVAEVHSESEANLVPAEIAKGTAAPKAA